MGRCALIACSPNQLTPHHVVQFYFRPRNFRRIICPLSSRLRRPKHETQATLPKYRLASVLGTPVSFVPLRARCRLPVSG